MQFALRSLDDSSLMPPPFPADTPLVSLKMGSSLQPALIKEGDDVYFECGVQANPRPHRLTWYKGDTEIVHNASAGVILSDQSLVLQSVTRAAAGDYSCLAANSEGAGASNPVSLQVRYAPVCATPAAEGGVYGALKHETVTLRCDVDSSPPPTSFVWTFNSSGEQNEVPPSSYTSNAFTSMLRYTPVRDVDFGTISCAAHNGVGEQDAPCLYRLIAASPPQSPQNCSVSRGGAARLRVACAPGVDGGLPQGFRLEVLELPYMLARFNFSSNSSPEFNVSGLDARVSYALRVSSLNAKGASDPVELYTVAARPPDKYTGASSSLSLSPMLVSLLALAALLAAAVCAVITALYRCSARRHAAGKQAPAPDALYLERSLESLSAKQDSYCVSPLRYEGGGAGGAGGVGGEDEPDIIPGNYDKLPPPPEYLRLRPAPYAPADMYSGTQFGDNCLSPGSLSRGVSARAADLAPRPEVVTTARKVKESCI
ncbi:unnamed protein product [Plutella xylostella]|uniref:(diamondback moth) hypothetical protein n=1 Tax=Plutella xylostella TaxID=51655 RepID=A0A8S4DVU8_PLUXY|nr:unnamed protein product [Plutella xylostella]